MNCSEIPLSGHLTQQEDRYQIIIRYNKLSRLTADKSFSFRISSKLDCSGEQSEELKQMVLAQIFDFQVQSFVGQTIQFSVSS